MPKKFIDVTIAGQRLVICPDDIMRIKFHRSFLNIGCRECDMHLHISIFISSGAILEFKIFINEEHDVLVDNIDTIAIDAMSEVLGAASFIVIDSKWDRHFINTDKVECCMQNKNEYTLFFNNNIRICVDSSQQVLNYFI